MTKEKKAYLIAEILLERSLPDYVIKVITDLAEEDIVYLKMKTNNGHDWVSSIGSLKSKKYLLLRLPIKFN